MIKKENFFEYMRTFFFTLLAVFFLAVALLGVIQYQVYDEQTHKVAEENSVDYYLVNIMIEKNKYLGEKDPDNYKINLKLGILYEIQSNFKFAEDEYKFAISKAPYDEFLPTYKLALLYLQLNRLEEAEKLMEEIDERPDKKLITYKAKVYALLGDKYYDKADYEQASVEYQKAIFYYKAINSKKNIKTLENSLASSYVYFAEQKIEQGQIQEAVEFLQMANTIVDAPIIKYKLALLFKIENPILASKYFDEVYKEEPSLINYPEYYKFLSNLAKIAEMEGDYARAELYKNKIKKIETFYQGNILYVEDLKIELIKGKIKLNRWFKKYDINLELKFKNVSGYAIKSLFLFVEFRDRGSIIDSYQSEIANDKYYLKNDETSALINIKTKKPQTEDDFPPKEIIASIYVSKQLDGYKLHLQDVIIKERDKHYRRKVKLFFLEFYLPEFLS